MKSFFIFNMFVVLSMLMPLSSWAQEDYAVVKDGTITFYYDNNKGSRDGSIYDVSKELAFGYPSWLSENFTIAVFDDSFSNYTPSTAAWWFNGCSNLTEVKNLQNLNLSQVTDMKSMFASCSSLGKIDISGLSTDNVKDMQNLFYHCSNLKELNLQGIDTKNVENMNNMFNQCDKLEILDLSSFNTSNVKNMKGMFQNCGNLKTIYASNEWTSIYVENGTNMFLGCFNLIGGNGTKCDGFGLSTPIDETYARIDSEATPGYFTYKAPSVPKAYTVYNGSTLTFYYDGNKDSREGQIYDIAEEYVGDGNFPAWQTANIEKVSFDNSFSNYSPKSTARWFHSCSKLIAIEHLNNLKTAEVTSMAGMFYGCKSLTQLDVSGFSTSNVTNMYCMFYECAKLENLDLSSFKTTNVTTLLAMFYGCSNIKRLNLSSFETMNVEDMGYMFFNCNNLKTIYAGDGWNTDKITIDTGNNMFWGCSSLVGGAGTKCDGITLISYLYAKIDEYISPGYFTGNATVNQEAYAVFNSDTLTFYYDENKDSREGKIYDVTKEMNYGYPSWLNDNPTVVVFDNSFSSYTPTTTAWWFNGCSKLKEIVNLSNLNLSKTEDMSYMFATCISLEKIDLRGLSTGNVKKMEWLFYKCSNLTELNLYGFDTKNVESMYNMFNQCGKIKVLDLSSFNTSNVTNMGGMFQNCGNLETIYVRDEWSTTSVGISTNMFFGCLKLVGGNGTKCDGFGFTTPIDDTYARIDKETLPGYFTYKTEVGIQNLTRDNVSPHSYLSLDGKIVTKPMKGIYIKNGKKITVK